jgi:hypothetical protein
VGVRADPEGVDMALGVVVEQGRQRGEAGAGDGGAVVEEVFGHGHR